MRAFPFRVGLFASLVGLVALPCRAAGESSAEEAPADPAVSEPRIDYRISGTFVPERAAFRGDATISFVNTTEKPLEELFFHAYLNAFSSKETLFVRKFRGGVSRLDTPGGLSVLSLTASHVSGSHNLWPSDETTLDPDRTDIVVRLPTPIARGQRVELTLAFEAKLPSFVARTGHRGDFFLFAQWFPKLAKLEPDGSFAHFAFHPFSEFYANYGTYDVTLDVPEKFTAFGSGEFDQGKRLEGGVRRYEVHLERVHDFAWVTAPDLVARDGLYESVSGGQARAVRLRAVRTESSLDKSEAILDTLEHALPHFEESYGRYPYGSLTVIDPPLNAFEASGMEYPTFIAAGDLLGKRTFGLRLTETVTAHELAHQWFYGIVGTNEHDSPFLDEGLTSFAEWEYLERRYPHRSALVLGPLTISRSAFGRYSALPQPPGDRLDKAAPDFETFRSLAKYAYGVTPLLLLTLGHVFGEEQLRAALLAYAMESRFAHPTPKDLLRHLENHLGPDARRTAEIVFELDGSYSRSLSLSKASEKSVALEVVESAALPLPIELELRFRDGSKEARTFPAGTRHIELATQESLAGITLDPTRKVLLDSSFADNRVEFARFPATRNRTRLRLLQAFQALVRLL